MKTKNIICTLQQIIGQAADHRYNAQVGRNSFVLEDAVQAVSIINENYRVRINPPLQSAEMFRYSQHWPQTRISHTRYQHHQFTIELIEYFDDAIFILQNENEDKNFSLSIDFTGSIRTFCAANGSFPVNETTLNISVEQSEILWFHSEPDQQIEKLPGFLNRIITAEYNLHPLAQIQSRDLGLLVEIDTLWNKMDFINRDRSISVQRFQNGRSEDLLWLQEFYLFMGWFEELHTFYNDIKQDEYQTWKVQQPDLLNICKKRFSFVDHPIGSSDIILPEDGLISDKGEASFFMQKYLFSEDNYNPALNSEIQDYWEYIMYPVQDFYFKKQFKNNPDEIFAFLMLAIHLNFYWHKSVSAKIGPLLKDRSGLIFEMLLNLKEHVNLHFSSAGIQQSPANDQGNLHSFQRHTFHSKYIRHNQNIFSVIGDEDKIECKIDKQVSFHFNPQGREVTIRPFLMKPPLSNPDLPFVNAIIDGYNILIPLVWEQFVVECNHVRLRFLRKKDRYQVNLKLRKNISQFEFSGESFEPGNELFHKRFINIVKGTGAIEIALAANYERDGSGYKSIRGQWQVSGYGFDINNILRTDLRVSLEQSKKSQGITSNAPHESLINIPENKNILKISAKRCPALTVPVNSIKAGMDSYLFRFLHADSRKLKNKLIIYSEADDKEANLQIRSTFFEHLGFYPQLRSLKEFVPDPNSFLFIIAKKHNAMLIRDYGELKIIQMNDNKNFMVFYLHPVDIKKMFSRAFFPFVNSAN